MSSTVGGTYNLIVHPEVSAAVSTLTYDYTTITDTWTLDDQEQAGTKVSSNISINAEKINNVVTLSVATAALTIDCTTPTSGTINANDTVDVSLTTALPATYRPTVARTFTVLVDSYDILSASDIQSFQKLTIATNGTVSILPPSTDGSYLAIRTDKTIIVHPFSVTYSILS